jgi:PTS system mannose-specific IIC component
LPKKFLKVRRNKMGATVMLALFLAIFTGITIVIIDLGFNMWGPLFYGIVAGIITGNVDLGLKVGATCSIMAVGFYTYGGATMPDYSIGAMFGVFMAIQRLSKGATSEAVNAEIAQVIPIVTAIALLMSVFNIAGRAATTVFQHGGDNALAKRNLASFQRWHLAGTIPWALSRAIPVFIGMLFINQYQVLADKIAQWGWLERSLGVVGKSLPAVGFALLLSYMDIATYWPYMLVGYVLFAYMNLEIIGLAIIGLAAAGIYMKGKKDLAKGGV